MRQAHDTEAANLEQAGQSGRGTGDAVRDVHTVIRDKIEAAREQTQEQVGLARPWWSDQQYAVAGAAGAAPVDLHDRPLWAGTCRKGSPPCRLAGEVPASPS